MDYEALRWVLDVQEALKSRFLFADTILFIRGATRAAEFLERTTASSRNEQLADINETATSAAMWAGQGVSKA